jgi:hypothetical protein
VSPVRRRAVPREWREEHHELDVYSRYYAGGAVRGSRVYRAGGRARAGSGSVSAPIVTTWTALT